MKRILLAFTCFALCQGVSRGDVFKIGLNSTNLFTGVLSGVFEVPANASPATGGEVGSGISFDNGTGLLDINLAYGLFGFQPLQGNYTASHIHEAPAGVNGPVVVSLVSLHTPIGTHAGFYQGQVALTSALETALFNDDLYINIHSTLFPGGEIRAQLIPSTVPEPSALAFLMGGLLTLFAFSRRSL